jgi:hypothetical protein
MGLGEGMEGMENEIEARVAMYLRNLGRKETLAEEHGCVVCLRGLKPGTELSDLLREAL